MDLSMKIDGELNEDTHDGPETELTIAVREVTKGYGSTSDRKAILKNINLSVKRGSIYCLLGPSGCGKTTLLRCVLGLLKIDGGDISVFGHEPGCTETQIPGPGVGYMPQDVALYDEMSILENVRYYGCLVGMSPNEIISRAEFLLELLDLSIDNKRLCGNLSGGQKRRVSFAISVMHEPRLLILDEPTVGIDPPIRKKVWDYLVLLAKRDGVTVILITHYLEEAKAADTVGLMIDGSLLAEASPDKLISDNKCECLEEVFLKLCITNNDAENSRNSDPETVTTKFLSNDTENNPADHIEVSEVQNGGHSTNLCQFSYSDYKADATKSISCSRNAQNESSSKCERSRFFSSFLFAAPSASRTKAVLKKKIAQSYHDPANIVLQFGLPIIVATLFSLSLGVPIKGLRLSVVNNDKDDVSIFYCNNLKSLDLKLETFSKYEDAYESVKMGNSWGVLYFPENLTNHMISRYLHGDKLEEKDLEHSKIQVTLDLSNQIVSHTLIEKFYQAYKQAATTILGGFGVNSQLGDLPIKLNNTESGWLASTQSYMAPGISMCAMFFMSMTLTAIGFLVERKDGQLERSLVAGVKPMEIVVAVSIFQTLLSLIEIVILYTIVILCFGYECRGPHVLLILMGTLQGLCGMGYGLIISSVCDNVGNAGLLIMGTFLPICVISGIIWPVQGMPYVFQILAKFLPPTVPSEGLRGVMARGWTLAHPAVYIGCLVPLAWFLCFLPLTVIFFRLKLKCAY